MWDTLRPPPAEERAAYYAAGWWREQTFLDDIAREARERPDHPAVVGYTGGILERTLTWAEYEASVVRCAAALTELGVGPGDVVAVYLPNRWLLGPLLFACARIGAVSSPVIPVLAGRELAIVLDASRAAVCVTVDSFGGVDYDRRLAEVAPPTLKHRVVVGDAARTGAIDFDEFFVRTPWEQRHPLDEVTAAGPDDPVLLLYTSGTTGAMKAVVHSQNTLYAAARTVAESQGLGPDDVISVPNFLTHMAGSSFAVSMPVLLGATTVMQDNNTDMELFLDLVARHRITWAYLSPSYLVNLLRIQRDTPRNTSSLQPRRVRLGAGAAGHRRRRAHGARRAAAHAVGDDRERRCHADPTGRPGGLGRAVRRHGRCRGCRCGSPPSRASSSAGCWSAAPPRPSATSASATCTSSASTPDGWFDTGDLARDDGRGGIRITGRRNDLITRASGQKVSDARGGDGAAAPPGGRATWCWSATPTRPCAGADLVCAVVVPAGTPPTVDELPSYLQDAGVAAVLCPDRVQFVWELPKNSLGKVLREPLRRRLEIAAGTPE